MYTRAKLWVFKIWILTQNHGLDCPELGLQGDQTKAKGNQSWIFLGRTDAEAEAPILWPLDEKSQLVGKDPDAGKDSRQEEKGMTEAEMVGWHCWVNGHEFEQASGRWWRTGKPSVLQSLGLQRVRHEWATEHQHPRFSNLPTLWEFSCFLCSLKSTIYRKWDCAIMPGGGVEGEGIHSKTSKSLQKSSYLHKHQCRFLGILIIFSPIFHSSPLSHHKKKISYISLSWYLFNLLGFLFHG